MKSELKLIEKIYGSENTIISIASQCIEKAERNTDWLPLSIAGLAVIFTAWQAQIARKHSKISVMPHLHVEIGLAGSERGGGIHLSIANNGLGPAIVKSFRIYREGKSVDLRGSSDNVDGSLRSLIDLDLHYSYQFTTFKGVAIIGPSVQVPVIVINGFTTDPKHPERTLQSICSRLAELDIEIEYEDAFRELFFFNSQDDSPIKAKGGMLRRVWLKISNSLSLK